MVWGSSSLQEYVEKALKSRANGKEGARSILQLVSEYLFTWVALTAIDAVLQRVVDREEYANYLILPLPSDSHSLARVIDRIMAEKNAYPMDL